VKFVVFRNRAASSNNLNSASSLSVKQTITYFFGQTFEHRSNSTLWAPSASSASLAVIPDEVANLSRFLLRASVFQQHHIESRATARESESLAVTRPGMPVDVVGLEVGKLARMASIRGLDPDV
jgi:hypothetical protein